MTLICAPHFPQIKCGFALNFLGIFLVNLLINTYGTVYFELDGFPAWANVTNT